MFVFTVDGQSKFFVFKFMMVQVRRGTGIFLIIFFAHIIIVLYFTCLEACPVLALFIYLAFWSTQRILEWL